MGYFVFNGINTADYGIYVTGTSVYGVPARDYTQISIPGRNGDIFIDNGRYKNIDITYHCSISGRGEGFLRKFEEFRRRLTASVGYQDLTDSYTVGYLRRGVMASSIFPKAVGVDWFAGEFDITFNCKPQMFLEQGMKVVQYTTFENGNIDSAGNITPVTIPVEWQTGIMTGKIKCSGDSVKLIDHSASDTTKIIGVHFYNGNTHVYYQGNAVEHGGTWIVSCSSEFDSVLIDTAYPEYKNDGYLEIVADDSIGVLFGGAMIYNDTLYDAKPIIEISNITTGFVAVVGAYSIRYEGTSTKVTIDCERQTAYTGHGNVAPISVTYSETGHIAEEFPSLLPGENIMTIDSGATIKIQTNIYTM